MVKKLDKVYYYRAVQKLAPYFGILSARDLSSAIALEQLQGISINERNIESAIQPSQVESKIVDLVINTREGALPIIDEVRNRNATGARGTINGFGIVSTPPTEYPESSQNDLHTALVYYTRSSTATDLQTRLSNFIKLHHSSKLNENEFSIADIGEMLKKQDDDNIVKKLSAIEIFSPNIAPSAKDTEGLSILFNGIPNIELARLIPYLDVQFMFGKPTADYDGNLSAPSIFKFLEGAIKVKDNSTLALLTRGNQIEGRIEGARNDTGNLAIAGMELFTSPQTMVNADIPNPRYNRLNSSTKEYELRSTSVIDKFRPFLSFKQLTIDVAPSVGLFSFKTAKMEFVLHDRSRLSEIADLVKPDLYGTTELMVEYGWSHPDGPEMNNAYADLFNSTRIKEKYGIKNVQFTFDEVGQVNITLELFTKGGTDIYTANIATASEATRQSIVRIQELSDIISRFRQALPNQSGQNNTREIRGIQALDAASDIQSNIRLSPEIINQIRELKRSLGPISSRNRDVSILLDSLTSLFQTINQNRNSRRGSQTTQTSALEQLSNSIQSDIRQQFSILKEGYDPFYPFGFELPDNRIQGAPVRKRSERFRRVLRSGQGANQRQQTVPGQTISNNILNEFDNEQVSLGKLLMTFIGQPLASTGNYDEIQFIFYPFNNYAGYARFLHTGQFMIDLRFMIEQYFRFRMESVSRAANVNLNEFMQFIQSTIIDDPAAPVYGIDDFYEKTINRDTNQAQTTARFDAVRLQTEISERLRNITPDGTFKQPTIDLYIESVPRKNFNPNSTEESLDNSKTILRIHVYDKQASQYEGLGSILELARDNTLSAFSTITADSTNQNSIIGQAQKQQIEQIINSAIRNGIIERINPSRRELNPDGRYSYYKFVGSQGKLKEFIMKTMPYIIYGCAGTTIQTANLTSQNDPALSSVNMIRSTNANPQRANGEQPGGLPIQIIPAELNINCFGNTLVNFAQRIFVDFQTGTTVDNIYVVNGLSHTITQGEFKTDIKLVFYDGYGKYRSFIDQVNAFAVQLDDVSRSNSNRRVQ
jgi:hypothetical protein